MLDWILWGILVLTVLGHWPSRHTGEVYRWIAASQLVVLLVFVVGRVLLPWFGLAGEDPSLRFVSLLGAVLLAALNFLSPQRGGWWFSVLLSSLAMLLFGFGLFLGPDILGTDAQLAVQMRIWYVPHVISAVSALATAMAAGVCAALFLAQDHVLKQGRLNISGRLPRMATLGRFLEKLLAASALFFTLTVLFGGALSVYVWHRPFSADPFSLAALLGFVAQVALYASQMYGGWASRRIAIMTLVVLTFWLVLVAVGSAVLPTQHSFVGLL